jgi:hypothetical protein
MVCVRARLKISHAAREPVGQVVLCWLDLQLTRDEEIAVYNMHARRCFVIVETACREEGTQSEHTHMVHAQEFSTPLNSRYSEKRAREGI